MVRFPVVGKPVLGEDGEATPVPRRLATAWRQPRRQCLDAWRQPPRQSEAGRFVIPRDAMAVFKTHCDHTFDLPGAWPRFQSYP